MTWALTTNGRAMPCDPETAKDGNVLLLRPRGLGQTLAVVLSGVTLKEAREKGVPLHAAHFASCPHAEDFRKRKSGATVEG